jgi:hypothetical protein
MLAPKTQWCRRPRGMNCPICDASSWCTISADGLTVRCTRAPSDRPAPSKAGAQAWIHELGNKVSGFVQLKPEKEKKYKSVRQVTELASRAFNHRLAPSIREHLARDLGVSCGALYAMMVGYGTDDNGAYSTWPSRNSVGEIVGINRRYQDGSKKLQYGTQGGLYYCTPRTGLSVNPILIVEGGSDAAAAYTIGLFAIGRHSNTGGADLIRAMNVSDLLVLGEWDEHPEKRGRHDWCLADCKGCSHCFPGLFGAKHTASQLGCKYIFPPKGCKDLREVLAQGRVGELLKIISKAATRR